MKTSNKKIDQQTEIRKLRTELDRQYTERERLNALLNISKGLAGELDLDTLLKKISREVKKALHADRCSIFLLDESTNQLWSKVATGVRSEIRFPADKGLAGHVCQTKEILNIKDAYKDERFNPEIDKKTGYKTKTILSIPLLRKGNDVIGVFQVLNKKDGSFTKENAELLTAIASMSSASIENALLYAEHKKSFISFVETLATTLDTRDYITAGHSRRVTKYALEIGKLMKLDIESLEILHYSGLLHDIGKIGVPEIVLFKDRKLTEDEYEIIKGHAKITQNILKKINFEKKYREIPQIASSHHEKIDGTGYPDQLKGDDIPLGGKILAVADVFDALTSRRQYQDRLDLEKVMKIIDTETGTSFEPFVVYNFKFISLDRLIRILEYGHVAELDEDDLERLTEYSLREIVEIRQKSNKTDAELEIENIFMRYYLRQYRTD
jgi:putative nucleotidyltransferase with HDIG domain